MTVFEKMTLLADAVRKRYQKSGKLSLDDMIRIITPPKYPILLVPNSFKVSSDWGGTVLTKNNGAEVTNNPSYISHKFYSSSKTLLDNPKSRPDLTLRFHLFATNVSGNPTVSWGINGSGTLAKWQPGSDEVSDFELPSGLAVASNNDLLIQCNSGSVTLDLAKCYLEIIGGGN